MTPVLVCKTCGQPITVFRHQSSGKGWKHLNGCKIKRVTCGKKPIPTWQAGEERKGC